ncbi:VOC family protein [Solirubrobacter taibaiensis]|nr:VOC family protein [Solirubrobacter taibaiensis]
MGERTSYAPGTLSWTELATSDADAAKAFYTELFGWSYDDRPVGPDMVYSMAQVDDKSVAALYQSEDPPHWNCYVTVASVDETVEAARGLGAQVLAEPFDVMTAGRSAALADPTGGIIYLWEPGDNIGAYLVNQPGAMAWNDLVTAKPDAAADFYGALFGWTFEEIPNAGGYTSIKNGDRTNGGVMPLDGPSAWMPYFGHASVDAVIERAEGLGAKLMNGPIPVPSGQFAVFLDPQGAVFGVLESSAYDD